MAASEVFNLMVLAEIFLLYIMFRSFMDLPRFLFSDTRDLFPGDKAAGS
jgi:hypothetical protein